MNAARKGACDAPQQRRSTHGVDPSMRAPKMSIPEFRGFWGSWELK
jgi:hypothetical protein